MVSISSHEPSPTSVASCAASAAAIGVARGAVTVVVVAAASSGASSSEHPTVTAATRRAAHTVRATAARRVDRTSTLPIESPRILDGDR